MERQDEKWNIILLFINMFVTVYFIWLFWSFHQALWLPGSQTELAIVTADFVKIYNLAEDAISPHFYFLLPSGKIRDATFIFTDDGQYLVLMASSGYIYTQHMDELSSAKHGPFYITNILDVKHPDIKVSSLSIL